MSGSIDAILFSTILPVISKRAAKTGMPVTPVYVWREILSRDPRLMTVPATSSCLFSLTLIDAEEIV